MPDFRSVAVIQARMGSSRLPGKILKQLKGRSVLEHVVRRARMADVFAEVVIATTTGEIDDQVCEAAKDWPVMMVRGDEEDVLSRFGRAAEASGASAIMRITADCPLIDPTILADMVDKFIAAREEGPLDLLTNSRVRTFPRGLDAEFFTRDVLDCMLNEAERPEEREHVTPFLYRHPSRFSICDYTQEDDQSQYRLTLDTPDDFTLISKIYDATDNPDSLRLPNIIKILENHPGWPKINAHIEQKTY